MTKTYAGWLKCDCSIRLISSHQIHIQHNRTVTVHDLAVVLENWLLFTRGAHHPRMTVKRE